jgi:hypothetical protein
VKKKTTNKLNNKANGHHIHLDRHPTAVSPALTTNTNNARVVPPATVTHLEGETRKRTNHRWPLSTNCFFVFCIHDEKQRQQCKSVVVFVFPPFVLYSNMVRPRWVQHAIIVHLLPVFLFPCFVLLQHSLFVLFKPTTHRMERQTLLGIYFNFEVF